MINYQNFVKKNSLAQDETILVPKHYYNYAILLEYDGNYFNGLQKQKSTKNTVQSEIECSLEKIFKKEIKVNFAGRTDSGVHSIGMIANFKVENQIYNYQKILKSLNALTSIWLTIKKIKEVPLNFHATYSCNSRRYSYMILNSSYLSPLLNKKVFWYPYKINFNKFESELYSLKGKNDFRSLSKHKSNLSKSTKRTILEIKLESSFVDNLFSISIQADGFLHNMIRTLIGTALDISRGKITDSILEIIAKKDRKKAGFNLPPYGLYFIKAYYNNFPVINYLYQ